MSQKKNPFERTSNMRTPDASNKKTNLKISKKDEMDIEHYIIQTEPLNQPKQKGDIISDQEISNDSELASHEITKDGYKKDNFIIDDESIDQSYERPLTNVQLWQRQKRFMRQKSRQILKENFYSYAADSEQPQAVQRLHYYVGKNFERYASKIISGALERVESVLQQTNAALTKDDLPPIVEQQILSEICERRQVLTSLFKTNTSERKLLQKRFPTSLNQDPYEIVQKFKKFHQESIDASKRGNEKMMEQCQKSVEIQVKPGVKPKPPRVKKPKVDVVIHEQKSFMDIERDQSNPFEEKKQKVTPTEEKKQKKQKVTPCEEKKQKVTPCEEKKQKVTPCEEKKQKVTPCEEKKQKVTPCEEKKQKVTPCEEKKQKVTPTEIKKKTFKRKQPETRQKDVQSQAGKKTKFNEGQSNKKLSQQSMVKYLLTKMGKKQLDEDLFDWNNSYFQTFWLFISSIKRQDYSDYRQVRRDLCTRFLGTQGTYYLPAKGQPKNPQAKEFIDWLAIDVKPYNDGNVVQHLNQQNTHQWKQTNFHPVFKICPTCATGRSFCVSCVTKLTTSAFNLCQLMKSDIKLVKTVDGEIESQTTLGQALIQLAQDSGKAVIKYNSHIVLIQSWDSPLTKLNGLHPQISGTTMIQILQMVQDCFKPQFKQSYRSINFKFIESSALTSLFYKDKQKDGKSTKVKEQYISNFQSLFIQFTPAVKLPFFVNKAQVYGFMPSDGSNDLRWISMNSFKYMDNYQKMMVKINSRDNDDAYEKQLHSVFPIFTSNDFGTIENFIKLMEIFVDYMMGELDQWNCALTVISPARQQVLTGVASTSIFSKQKSYLKQK